MKEFVATVNLVHAQSDKMEAATVDKSSKEIFTQGQRKRTVVRMWAQRAFLPENCE